MKVRAREGETEGERVRDKERQRETEKERKLERGGRGWEAARDAPVAIYSSSLVGSSRADQLELMPLALMLLSWRAGGERVNKPENVVVAKCNAD